MTYFAARQRRKLPPLKAVIREPAEPALRWVVSVLAPVLERITFQDWRRPELVPRHGGAVLAVNHISYFDPLAFGHFLVWSGRWPRFLAKESLFRAPLIGPIVRRCGQIPVCRNTPQAKDAVAAAIAAVRSGRIVCIYPEGTATRDPEGWPMTAKSGAARIALESGCPVIPVGQWGAHQVMTGRFPSVPKLWPRRVMHVAAGEPVELDDLRGQPITDELLDLAGERIMLAITRLVAEVRDEPAPAGRWNPVTSSRR